MALPEKHLEVKTSTIPGAGKGLFTTVPIAGGTRIVEYKGRITTWKEVESEYDNVYLYTVTPDYVIDAKKQYKALARYANDAKGLKKVKGMANNCRFVNEGKKVFIEAVKAIPAGAELLVDYGKKYWDTVRANRELDKKG